MQGFMRDFSLGMGDTVCNINHTQIGLIYITLIQIKSVYFTLISTCMILYSYSSVVSVLTYNRH